MPVKRSTTRPVASKPPAYTPPVDDIAAQLEAHIASINDADPNAAFERQELTRSLREYLRVKNSFRDADERIGINALEYSEMTENEKRLTVLRDYHLHNPNVSEDELVNWRAVMAAYSSGLLDLKDKKAPNEVALFWNGRLIQSWHVQGNNELEKWAEYKKMWGGKAWVEKGELGAVMNAMASSFQVYPDGLGHYYVDIYALHSTMPTIEVRFETLDDSGCTVFTLFEADLPSLGIGPGSQAYQNRSVVNTANGQVYRDVVRLKLVWKDPGTDAHICYVFEEDCNVMPGAWNPALGRNRLSGLSLRRKAYMATAPVEPVVLNVAETRHGVFKNIPT